MASRFSYDTSALTLLPPRPARSNKGSFGRVVVIGGSVGMAGAAYFAGKAAYRSGCGLVTLLTPEANRLIYQTALPEAVLALYPDGAPDEAVLKSALQNAAAVVLGPGLGQSPAAAELVRLSLSCVRAPLVLDADGLNLLAGQPDLRGMLPDGSVITPHAGEMARLTGLSIPQILEDVPALAESFARENRVITVLKDHETAVSDGERTMINHSGNSGMATGGSGDVLSGIIAGLLAQGLKPFEAAALGVYLHGRAGDLAASRLGEYAVMASDILDSLPAAFRE